MINMKNSLLLGACAMCLGCSCWCPSSSCAPGAEEAAFAASVPVRKTRLQAHPDSRNWKSLFNLDLSNAQYEKGIWSIDEKGDLTASADSAIWTVRKCRNFILDFEYKLEPGANSGCIIYCSDKKDWVPGSVEIQLLDDNSPHWKNEKPQNRNGGLYGHFAPLVNNVKPAGEWNRMTIWAFGKRIRVAVNGELTVDAHLDAWKSATVNPDGSEIPSWLSVPWNKVATEGFIGFQGKHGGAKPFFRFIRIKECD